MKKIDYQDIDMTGMPYMAYCYKHASKWKRRKLWLILLKDDSCGRGEYAEELDVIATTKAQAGRIAAAVLSVEYQPDVRIGKIIWQRDI